MTNTKKEIEKLINNYLKKEKEVCLDIKEKWRLENSEKGMINYPRIYSNQYYAFMELQDFWKELKLKLKELGK